MCQKHQHDQRNPGRSQSAEHRVFQQAPKAADPKDAELVFGDANLISELMLANKTFCGIEISQPGMGYIDLVPKTHMGVRGALFLIEQVLNGLMSRL